MTTTQTRAGRRDPGDGPAPSPQPTGGPAQRTGWLARHPEWPIVAYLVGYPLWWALGVADFMPIVLAVPMARRMYLWSVTRERRLRLPPGFAIWFMFLVVAVAGVTVLSQTAPETIAGAGNARFVSYGLRTLDYIGCTFMLLYAGNLTEREFPRRRIAWLLGLVGIYATVGGLAGVLDPGFQFTAPVAALVPNSLQANSGYLQVLLHPGLSEVQGILGYAEGRPKAPFDYTNTWGNCLAILLPWLIVVWGARGNRRQRRALVAVLLVAAVAVVYSLDRGLWVGLGCGFLYLALRAAARGRLAMLASIVAAIALLGVLVVASPLGSLISQRLQHGKSNQLRSSLALISVHDAEASPFIGYGDTRHMQGSTQSIAIGKTSKCLSCGSRDVGGNGQLWLLLISTGFIGTALYLGFFAYGAWRYRRDNTPYGWAAVLVILLGFVFMIVYQSIGFPLAATMLSYAVLWRNERAAWEQAKRPGLRHPAARAELSG